MTRPLISLAAVGQLDLLRRLYSDVVIPLAVHREVTLFPDTSGALALHAASWIRVQAVADRTLVEALSLTLDSGEAEAIALAVETESELLLIDERRGREVATRMGRRVVGVLGVLIDAKKHGHLSAVRPVLDALIVEAGFRVGHELKERVLDAAGE